MLKKIKAVLKGKQTESKATKDDLSLAMAVLMVEIMHSDDQTDGAEKLVIKRTLQKNFPLSETEVASLMDEAQMKVSVSTDFHQFTSVIKDSYSTEERIAFLTNLWQVAMADGHIDADEEHLIRRIANLIGIYHHEFIDAKIKARQTS